MRKMKFFSKEIKSIAIICLSLVIVITTIVANPITMIGDTTSPSNNWQASDLRKHLNSAAGPDATNSSNSSNEQGYASHFTYEEYSLIQPSRYNTNGTELVDKFYLPNRVENANSIGWGITAESTEDYVIPQAYIAKGRNWLRIPDSNYNDMGIVSDPPYGVLNNRVYDCSIGVASIFRIDIEEVIFASNASAAQLLAGRNGVQKIILQDWNGDSNDAPSYGMYLKTKDRNFNKEFKLTEFTFENGRLHIAYNGADKGKAIVVQAIEGDGTSYVMARKVGDSDESVDFDTSSCLTSSDNMTFAVWMENPESGVNLAEATTPQYYIYSGGTMMACEEITVDKRIFALRDQLSASWGTVTSGGNAGTDASNQIIYYGTDADGKPLQFWIAGREVERNGEYQIESGTMEPFNMCLYQAKSVENRAFDDVSESLDVEIRGDWDNIYCNKEPFVISVNAEDDDTCSYYTSNPYVATIDDTGEVEIRNVGIFEIVAYDKIRKEILARTEQISVVHSLSAMFEEIGEEDGKKVHAIECVNCGMQNIHMADFKDDSNGKHECNYVYRNHNGNRIECNVNENHDGGTANCHKLSECSVCNAEYGSFDMNKHEYDTSTWKYDEMQHWNSCLYHAEASVNKAIHQWSEWIVEKEATTNEEGLRTRTCMICNAEESETLDKISIPPADNEDKEGNDGNEGGTVPPVTPPADDEDKEGNDGNEGGTVPPVTPPADDEDKEGNDGNEGGTVPPVTPPASDEDNKDNVGNEGGAVSPVGPSADGEDNKDNVENEGEENPSVTPPVAPPVENGSISVEVKKDYATSFLVAENLTIEFVKKLLSIEELAAVDAGNDIVISLNCSALETDGLKADKIKIENFLAEKIANGKIGLLFDLSLLKEVGNADAVKITELGDNKLEITMHIPEDLYNSDRNITRKYYVVRVHDGNVELLTNDTTEYQIQFETDGFSTYAIVYTDTIIEADADTETDTNTEMDSNTEKDAVSPKTRDTYNGAGILLLFAGIVAYALLREKRNMLNK